MDLAVIILGSMAVFFLVYMLLYTMVRRRTVGEVHEVMAQLSSQKVLAVSLRASLLAFDSQDLDASPVKGSRDQGTLVLTDKEIYFDSPARRKWLLPLSTVTEARLLTSSQKRSKKGSLMRVAFTEADGRPEAATWQLPNAEDWVSKLEGLIGGQTESTEERAGQASSAS